MTDPAHVPEWMSKLADANQRIAELEQQYAVTEDQRFIANEARESWRLRAEQAEAERDAAIRAVNWACGCAGSDFGEQMPASGPRYWWRKVLTKKAGLVYDRKSHRYVLDTDRAKAGDAIEELEAERDALKCCFMCHYYDEGFCLWCATPSNGLATPAHPRCTTCRCTPSRWTPREADHETD